MKYRIYLAVPGKNVCWGTVMGVVRSTAKHECLPFNGGFGFSGQEDFNVLWADAMNLYESGEITHFAMLHGDISPDPKICWLDVLLQEMDELNASLVSVASPIKDGRGLTSVGICDLEDQWRPFRRFTVRECLEKLPPTFNNVDAGYPERPLLHNTALWVCDLRRPVFRTVTNTGELDMYFRFPTRAIRGEDGKWMHQRESEDWAFSRDLWNRGVKDTYITTKVRLVHHGSVDFSTHSSWGSFQDGDENTADKWRAEIDALPLRLVQMLEFELGRECNYGTLHDQCPNMREDRYGDLDTSQDMDDITIVNAAVEAYTKLGFTGLIGWIYYNEPLMQAERMFRLMNEIKSKVPAARFILWTNGTLIPEECGHFLAFEQIIVSDYDDSSRRGVTRLQAKNVGCKVIQNAPLDGRLHQIEPADKEAPCLRPFVELIFDTYGNSHLCCYDWQGKATLGNLIQEPFSDIAKRWRDQLPSIAGHKMNGQAPSFCRDCGHRWNKYQKHDDAIVDRARRWREEQEKAAEVPS